MSDILLPAADDFHIHLRDDVRTQAAIRAVRHGGTSRVLAMPNTTKPVLTGEDAVGYRDWLRDRGADFGVWTSIKLTAETTPEMIESASRLGVTAGKLYPQGVTTNSEDGVLDARALYTVFESMQAVGMALSLHGEVPGVFVMDAERAFLDVLAEILRDFPRLRVVLEHITTAAAVEFVRVQSDGGLVATITDHHLALTLDDVVGSRIRPHHFCMPIAKRPEDRRALLQVVAEGDSRFFSGTDSAPHLPRDKESPCGCAGIFNGPYHMQFLATLFKREGILTRLKDFTSTFGRAFYDVTSSGEEIALLAEPLEVPARFDGLVPFGAGQTLDFRLRWLNG